MNRRFLFALAMPVVLIFAVLIMVYWPGTKPTADENFIFSLTETPFCASGSYVVEHQKVVWHSRSQKNSQFCKEKSSPQLYLYNAIKKQIEPLDRKSANIFRVDTSKLSPHGFSVSDKLHADGGLPLIYFLSGDSPYLLGHNQAILLPLPPTTGAIYREFKFLGWVQV